MILIPSINITVTVENQGYATEIFNVTAYANETTITLPNGENYTTVTLSSGDSATITFKWNTTDLARGNYTIKANVTQVLGETDPLDNTLFDDTIYVGIPGDVDGNHIVNMLDMYNIAIHFGASSGQPGYVSNYDIEDNGIINMLDLYIAATHFGQTDP